MTTRIGLHTFLSLSLSLAAVGCASTTMPNAKLADAKSSLSAAQAADAAEVPDGALHLKLSDDAIHAAEGEMQKGNETRADMLLERAKADADLALLIARENQAREQVRQFENRTLHDHEQ